MHWHNQLTTRIAFFAFALFFLPCCSGVFQDTPAKSGGQIGISLEKIEICRQVGGYGVYEPFVIKRFFAGRENPVLVYAEIENFKHVPREDGEYEVRLEHTIELFDAAGQAVVWRSGPESMVDVSRNKRRDFFIVKRIDLPQHLPVGGYQLTVRVADKHSGFICEQTMHDIQIVEGQGLVGVR